VTLGRLRWALLAILLLAPTVGAANFDFEQIPVANVSIGFTVSKITPAGQPPMTFAQCRVRTAELSYLVVDPAKTAVTSTVGTLLEPNEIITFTRRKEILNFRAIRTTSTSGQLDCWYKGAARHARRWWGMANGE
jgi:hypothetical protein